METINPGADMNDPARDRLHTLYEKCAANFAEVVSGYQPLDADLTAIAALSTTSYGRAILTLADAAALTALVNTFTSSLKGLVPASGGGTTNFLRADGSFAYPAHDTNESILPANVTLSTTSGTYTTLTSMTLTVPTGGDGTYLVHFTVRGVSQTTGAGPIIRARLTKNGSAVANTELHVTYSNNANETHQVSGTRTVRLTGLVAGDVIGAEAAHIFTGTVTLGTVSSNANGYTSMVWERANS